MSLVLAFSIGAICVALVVLVAWATVAIGREGRDYEQDVARVRAEIQLDQLTAQTLLAMRDAARRAGGSS